MLSDVLRLNQLCSYVVRWALCERVECRLELNLFALMCLEGLLIGSLCLDLIFRVLVLAKGINLCRGVKSSLICKFFWSVVSFIGKGCNCWV